MPIISTAGLARTFQTKRGPVEAVRGIDLTVRAAARSSASSARTAPGKTTTLRMLTTLLAAHRRRGHRRGLRPGDATRRACGAACGYVAQSGGVDPQITVREELVTQGRLYRLTKAEAAERAEELAARPGPRPSCSTASAAALSGGQRRRLDIAMALTHRPQVLFLDEPTTGLDPGSRADLWELVRRLRDEHGTTVFLTTHYLDEADALSDRLVVVDKGVVVAEGTPARAQAAARRLGRRHPPGHLPRHHRARPRARRRHPRSRLGLPMTCSHDTALIFGRYARQTLRSRFADALRRADAAAVSALLRPAADRSAARRARAAPGRSWCPGLLLQLGLFGASFAGFTIIIEKQLRGGRADARHPRQPARPAAGPGAARRRRSSSSRRCCWCSPRWSWGCAHRCAGVLIGFAFVALLTVSLASLSYALALKVRTPQEFGPVDQRRSPCRRCCCPG